MRNIKETYDSVKTAIGGPDSEQCDLVAYFSSLREKYQSYTVDNILDI